MTNERWRDLSENDDLQLTLGELAEGWHFCQEFDGLLRQPRDAADDPASPDTYECPCLKPEQP